MSVFFIILNKMNFDIVFYKAMHYLYKFDIKTTITKS